MKMTALKSVSFGAELDAHVASGKLAKCLIRDMRRSGLEKNLGFLEKVFRFFKGFFKGF